MPPLPPTCRNESAVLRAGHSPFKKRIVSNGERIVLGQDGTPLSTTYRQWHISGNTCTHISTSMPVRMQSKQTDYNHTWVSEFPTVSAGGAPLTFMLFPLRDSLTKFVMQPTCERA